MCQQVIIAELFGPVGHEYAVNGACNRVFINAGGAEVVKFSVDVASELKLLGRDFNWVVEPGVFKVMVGGAAADAGGDHCGGDAHGRCAQEQFSVG